METILMIEPTAVEPIHMLGQLFRVHLCTEWCLYYIVKQLQCYFLADIFIYFLMCSCYFLYITVSYTYVTFIVWKLLKLHQVPQTAVCVLML